jgi:hypothetical protein
MFDFVFFPGHYFSVGNFGAISLYVASLFYFVFGFLVVYSVQEVVNIMVALCINSYQVLKWLLDGQGGVKPVNTMS